MSDADASDAVDSSAGTTTVGDLFGALAVCYAAMAAYTAAGLAPLGLTEAKFRVLRVLEGGPRNGMVTARATGMSPQAVMSVLGALQERGYITRTPRPRGVGRAIDLGITERGREALVEARLFIDHAENQLRAALTSAEYDEAVQLVRRISKSLTEMHGTQSTT